MRPGVRAVHGYIDGDIPDNPDSLSIGISLQLSPLPDKLVLQIFLKLYVKIIFPLIIVHGIVPAQPDILRPFRPFLSAEHSLDCHENCIIPQPPAVFIFESLKFRVLRNIATFISFPKQLEARPVYLFIVYGPGPFSPILRAAFFFCQHAFFHQSFQTDQVRISRKRRKRLIRRISIAGRAKRQNLPVALSAGLQPVHKVICFF